MVLDEVGAQFMIETAGLNMNKMAAHPACIDMRRDGHLQIDPIDAQKNAAKRWNGLCPPEFQKDIDWTYRRAKQHNLDEIMAWRYGSKGLLIHGTTGLCKTRFLYQLLRREFDIGRSMFVMSHSTWRMKCAAIAQDSQAKLIKWVHWQSTVDIWALDDLGKGQITPSSEEALEEIVNQRTMHGRPIIATTMHDMASLEAKMSPDRGVAMIRRLLDYCDPIEFTP